MEGYTCRPMMIYSKLVVCMVACPKPVGLGQAICMGVVGQVYHFFTKNLHLVHLLAVYQSQWSTHPCSDLPTLTHSEQ